MSPAMSSRLKYGEDKPGSFALIRVPDGCKAPGDVIAHGSMSSVTQCLLDSVARSKAEALLARADEAAEQEKQREQREQQLITEGVRALHDRLDDFGRRLDAIERSRDARRQLDAQSAATEKMLALPKGSALNAPADETHQPGGELHVIGPEDPEKQHQPAADQGDLPEELVKQAPGELGNYPTLEEQPRRQISQPVAISLNEA
jgi:hypothetical protein